MYTVFKVKKNYLLQYDSINRTLADEFAESQSAMPQPA